MEQSRRDNFRDAAHAHRVSRQLSIAATTPSRATLEVSAGDTLFVWVYLDPANPPKEIMLMWNDGSSWEHRAYWGADSITYGTTGSAGRFYAGALPATGQWVKLSVPAKSVGVEGAVLTGTRPSGY